MDNNTNVVLYDNIILKYNLLLKDNISDNLINKIIEDNNIMDIYYKMIVKIKASIKSEKEIYNILSRKYDEKICDTIINKLKKEGYIDDYKYIDSYINYFINNKTGGIKKLRYELTNKGIDSSLIDEKLSLLDNSIFDERMRKIINNKLSNSKKNDVNIKNKIINYLIRCGYLYDNIISVVNEFDL